MIKNAIAISGISILFLAFVTVSSVVSTFIAKYIVYLLGFIIG